MFPINTLGTGHVALLSIVVIWSLVWKGLALWKAAEKKEKVWFVVFLLVNTLGILEIIYLIINRKKTLPQA